MTTLSGILTAAQSLPSADRAQLIAALWNDVGPNEWVPPDDQWIVEAQRCWRDDRLVVVRSSRTVAPEEE